MDVLWDGAGVDGSDGAAAATNPARTVREVFAVLSADRDIAYTTVMTVLDRLAKKGLVVQHRDGKAYRYTASEPRAAMVARLMMEALDDSDAHVRQAALVRFAERVQPDEAATLQAALADIMAGRAGDADGGAPKRDVASKRAAPKRGRRSSRP